MFDSNLIDELRVACRSLGGKMSENILHSRCSFTPKGAPNIQVNLKKHESTATILSGKSEIELKNITEIKKSFDDMLMLQDKEKTFVKIDDDKGGVSFNTKSMRGLFK